ncbi:TPA: hypothetical protein DCQ44_02300 [Candidatus Taylorbacteria bacterium]|nr:hypothetical protein [Candidatus Taylorbacteria bacterium]
MNTDKCPLKGVVPYEDVKKVYRKFRIWRLSLEGRIAVRRLVRDSTRRSDREIRIEEVLDVCQTRWDLDWKNQPQVLRADPHVGYLASKNKGIFEGIYIELKLTVPGMYKKVLVKV